MVGKAFASTFAPLAPMRSGDPTKFEVMMIRALHAMTIFAVVGLTTSAMARNYGQYDTVDPETRNWVQGLKDKSGQGCCDTADGHPAEYEWDIAGSGYRVRIEGEWYEVPPDAVIKEPNRLGFATVWYSWSWDLAGKKTHHIRCFLPGAGG
jgi:hypothetical protein